MFPLWLQIVFECVSVASLFLAIIVFNITRNTQKYIETQQSSNIIRTKGNKALTELLDLIKTLDDVKIDNIPITKIARAITAVDFLNVMMENHKEYKKSFKIVSCICDKGIVTNDLELQRFKSHLGKMYGYLESKIALETSTSEIDSILKLGVNNNGH